MERTGRIKKGKNSWPIPLSTLVMGVKLRKGSTLTLIVLITIVLCMFAGAVYLSYQRLMSSHGAVYEATITITSIETSTRMYPHTYIYTERYVFTSDSFQNDATQKQYTFAGVGHDITSGKTYYIRWHNEIRFNWLHEELIYTIGIIEEIVEVT